MAFGMSDLVIWFYGIILLIVKQHGSQRFLDWQIRFFERRVSEIDPTSDLYQDAVRMAKEIALCRHRRSPRKSYNISYIDEVYAQYYIHKSPVTLDRAWDLFFSGAYRLEGCA